jgi:hypothetical protein
MLKVCEPLGVVDVKWPPPNTVSAFGKALGVLVEYCMAAGVLPPPPPALAMPMPTVDTAAMKNKSAAALFIVSLSLSPKETPAPLTNVSGNRYKFKASDVLGRARPVHTPVPTRPTEIAISRSVLCLPGAYRGQATKPTPLGYAGQTCRR